MKFKLILIAVALAAAGLTHAAVTAEEAARLGKDLTPWGAEKAGNKEGTIPPYTGGLAVDLMGPSYDSNKSIVNGRQFQPDPFKDEKPLYRITAKNLSQYADKLSEATKVLFKNDPNYFVDVYPTHRVVNYPQSYLDASIKNATRCKSEQNGTALKGCKGGMPFPIPKTGEEVVWNMRGGGYYGPGLDVEAPSVFVAPNGTIIVTNESFNPFQYPFQDSRYSLEEYEDKSNNHSFRFYRLANNRIAPPRVAGEATLYHLFSDGTDDKVWSYQPGNRRVRASPNASHDFPTPSGGGAAFYDESYVFQGLTDRFDWKLLGKKEMILPYSNYRLAWGDMNKVMGTGKPKPEYMRWELHRAWVVEATRKPGARHAYAKRRYYIDEDTVSAAMGDNWDDSGNIARGNFASAIWIWDYQCNQYYFWNSDITTGAYFTTSHPGNASAGGSRYRKPDTGIGGFNNGPLNPDSDFTPEALARRTQR